MGDSAGLHLEGLTLAPPGGGKPLTAALHASIGPGQSLLVVGPSGCGKSSLLRAIAGALCRGPWACREARRSVLTTSSGSTGAPNCSAWHRLSYAYSLPRCGQQLMGLVQSGSS